MNGLEELLRDTFVAYEAKAPDPTRVLDAVRNSTRGARPSRPAMRRLVPAVLVVLVVAIASLALVSLTPSPDRPGPGPVAGPEIPDGKQSVSFHGIQLYVPASWKMHDARCGTPVADTVMTESDGPVHTCLIPPVPGLTVVHLNTADGQLGRARATVATEPVEVEGHQGRRGVGTPESEPEPMAVLVFEDPGVVVSVTYSEPDEADRILDSVRVTPVDSLGCRDHVDPLEPSGPSKREGAESALVPGTPSAASVCRYSDNWLARSIRLTDEQTTELVEILNALPTGTSQPGPEFSASEEVCLEETKRGFVARFSYPSGPAVEVFVRIGACENLNASNGSRATKIDEPLVMLLTTVAGYDGGFPDPGNLR